MRSLLIALGVALVLWLAIIIVLLAAGRRAQAREVATLIPNLLRLFRELLRDARVPWSSKAWLWFAVVWLVSPIDIIPEFIPVLGPLDDALVAALVLRHVVRSVDRSVIAEHWRGELTTLDWLAGSRDGERD